jgi:hypothetical protein
LWSPREVREARVRQTVKEREEKELQSQKAERVELKKANKLTYTKFVYCRRSVWRGLRPKQRGNKRKQSKPPAEPRRRALEGQKRHSNNESNLLIRVISKL